MHEFSENRRGICPVAAARLCSPACSLVFEAVDDRSVNAEAEHHEELGAVGGWDINDARRMVAFKIVSNHPRLVGHPKMLGDQVRGSGGQVVNGDLKFAQGREEVVHRAVTTDDDEAVECVGGVQKRIGWAVHIVEEDAMSTGFEFGGEPLGSGFGFAAPGSWIGEDGDVHQVGDLWWVWVARMVWPPRPPIIGAYANHDQIPDRC